MTESFGSLHPSSLCGKSRYLGSGGGAFDRVAKLGHRGRELPVATTDPVTGDLFLAPTANRPWVVTHSWSGCGIWYKLPEFRVSCYTRLR